MRRSRLVAAGVLLAAVLAGRGAHVPHAAAATPGPFVLAFGDAQAPGSPSNLAPARPIVGMAATPDGRGYWLVASDGGVFAFGTATFHGSTGGIALQRPIVGIASTPDGRGYWLAASDGGVFAFGTATFHGSTGATRLAQPIVGVARATDGRGYWLVASDGGVFNFGTAAFHGSTGATALQRPVVGMAATPDGSGYWLLASDGGVFDFGSAVFHGSAAGHLGAGRVAAAIVRSPTGRGYTVLAVAATVRVGFTGDVHGVGRVATFMARGGDPLAGMRPLLAANQVNVVNLETAVGTTGSAQAKQYTFQSPPELLRRLRAAGVTAVNLGNNHALDFGTGALLETIAHARDAGLVVVGAGANKAEAFAPAIVATSGGTVAVLGFSQVVPPGWAATATSPGVASAYDVAAATAAVREARTKADHVVVMVHAGVESVPCPTGPQRSISATLIDAGADVVAGGHPHVLQGIERRGRGLIAYSLGNFVWYSGNPPTGLMSVDVGPDGVASYDLAPARIDSTGSPQPLSGPAADEVRAHVASLAPGAGRC